MRKVSMMLVLCMLFVMSGTSKAEAPADGDLKVSKPMKVDTLKQIEKGVLYLLRCCPIHPVVRDANLRLKIAAAIYKASEKSGYAWPVITAIAYAESSFDSDAEGPIGEVGFMQLHTERPWRHCQFKEQRKVSKTSLEDQLICGAHWLRFGQEKVCNGSLKQGVAKFMTRSTCVPEKESRLAWKVNRRLKIMRILKTDKVQVEYEEIKEANDKKRAKYIAKRKAKRRAKLQAKWDKRWKARQKKKKEAQAQLQQKWDKRWKELQQNKKAEKGIIFTTSNQSKEENKG